VSWAWLVHTATLTWLKILVLLLLFAGYHYDLNFITIHGR
jgi:hypothetical protein